MARFSANDGPPQSRTALTSRLGLSPSSLTRLTQSLLSRGVLVELADESTGAVGRPSRPLDIAPQSGEFIGVKLTGDHLYAVTTGIRADRRSTYDHPLPDPSPDAVAGEIVRAVLQPLCWGTAARAGLACLALDELQMP